MAGKTTEIVGDEAEKVFKEGVLCVVSIGVWGGRIKLPPNAYKVEADKDFTLATKYLVDRRVLRPVNKVRAKARQVLFDNCLPFPIPGAKFIPRKLIPFVESELQAIQAEFYKEVETFCNNYDKFMEQAKSCLRGLFNPKEYPGKGVGIRSKFYFDYKYIMLSSPQDTSVLPPELYEREQEKFANMMSDFKSEAVTVLRTKFAEMVEHVVERLTDEKKIFKNSTVENVNKFLNDFEALNISNDTELEKQVDVVKSILEGADPKVIRTDKDLRKKIASQMTEVQDQLIKGMKIRPKRKIRVAQSEATPSPGGEDE